MKVLFLDIDGVLNSAEWSQENHQLRLKLQEMGLSETVEMNKCRFPLGHLSPRLIDKLNTICEFTDCKIVISSTWRLHHFNGLPSYLVERGFKYPSSIIGRTDNFNISYGRGYEIHEWLNKNADIVKSFAILDDDCDMHHLTPYLINTEYMIGLTDEDVQLTIDVLNGNIAEVPLHELRRKNFEYMTTEIWKKP